MKKIALIFLLFSCGEGEVKPTNSFCIYQRPAVSTTGGNVGAVTPWKLVGCQDDPDYYIHTNKYKGYKTNDCNCRNHF